MADENDIKYIGFISGMVTINPIPIGKDFECSCNVENPYDPVEVLGFIFGDVHMNNNWFEKGIESELNILKQFVDKDINSDLSINKNELLFQILSTVTLDKEIPLDLLLDSNLVINLEERTIVLDGIVTIPFEFNKYLPGIVTINLENLIKDFNASAVIKDIKNSNDINVLLSLIAFPYKIDPIRGRFVYKKSDWDKFLNGSLYLLQSELRVEFMCKCLIKKFTYYYDFYSYCYIANRFDLDIPCSCMIKNDGLYDIRGIVDIYPKNLFKDLESFVIMQDYSTKEIDCSMEVDKIYTRRDLTFHCLIVNPVNKEFECSCNVNNIYYNIGYEFNCNALVGATCFIHDFTCFANILESKKTKYEFNATCIVSNRRSPKKVSIICDPLWRYDPFVVRASLATFFDRIYTKNQVSVVYGGDYRFNWDVNHYCGVFGIPLKHQCENKLIYDAKNTNKTKQQAFQMIHNMIEFSPNGYKRIDRVIIFMNRPYSGSNLTMGPILDFCRRYAIPTLIIDSGGDFVELNSLENRMICRDKIFDHQRNGLNSVEPKSII